MGGWVSGRGRRNVLVLGRLVDESIREGGPSRDRAPWAFTLAYSSLCIRVDKHGPLLALLCMSGVWGDSG